MHLSITKPELVKYTMPKVRKSNGQFHLFLIVVFLIFLIYIFYHNGIILIPLAFFLFVVIILA